MAKKPTLPDLTTSYASATQLNAAFRAIEEAFDNTVSRDGSTPNTMTGDLDLNGNRLLNVDTIDVDNLTLNGQVLTDVTSIPQWESTWLTATAYAKNDMVKTAGSVYICLVAHTSGTFSTDLTNGRWELMVSKGDPGDGATAAQGAKADSALQPTDISSNSDWTQDTTKLSDRATTDARIGERTRQALNASGDAPIYACRAWVNFNGTGTPAIRAAGNVSSITDRGVDGYVMNFMQPMPDANYAAVASCRDNLGISAGSVTIEDTATTGVRFFCRNPITGGVFDPTIVCVSIFR